MTNRTETRFATILIFTDFSSAALNAVNYAAYFAQQVHAKRLLICYSEFIPSTTDVHVQNVLLQEQLHERNIAKLEAIVRDLKTRTAYSLSIDAHIDRRPLDVIVESLNRDHSVDLIVLGLAGRSAFEQSFFGNFTVRITEITTVPALIIPESASFKAINNVVFACNLKKISENTPVFAIKRLVDKLGARVSILSVGTKEDSFNPETMIEPRYLRQFWGRQEHKYHHTSNEDIVMEIMNFATANHVQLVIAVPKKYGFFENIFHNSVTKKLTYHIHLPLLLFKEEKS